LISERLPPTSKRFWSGTALANSGIRDMTGNYTATYALVGQRTAISVNQQTVLEHNEFLSRFCSAQVRGTTVLRPQISVGYKIRTSTSEIFLFGSSICLNPVILRHNSKLNSNITI
jgi:hypothetical protein